MQPWSPWQSVLSIWFGMVQIGGVKRFLIKSQWRSWLDLLENWALVWHHSRLMCLRKSWKPLSCNSITIHPDEGRLYCSCQMTAGVFLVTHMAIGAGLVNQRATFGGQKSPFTLGQLPAAKSLNSITEIASENTDTQNRARPHSAACASMYACRHTHTYRWKATEWPQILPLQTEMNSSELVEERH